MKKHQKKRIGAFIVGLVLSIMITPFCFLKIAEPVAAANNVITYNNYGSFTRTMRPVSINNTDGFSMSSIDAELNMYYVGSVTLNISCPSGLTISDFCVVCDNCYITSYSSTYVNITFQGVNHWNVSFSRTTKVGLSSIDNSYVTIQSLSNWNMTSTGAYSEIQELHGINNRLDTLQSYTDNIETLLATNNSLLNDIKTNTASGGGGSSYVVDIDANVDLIADDIALISSDSASILSSLIDFLTDGLGQIITMDMLMSELDDVINQLSGVNTNLVNCYNQLTQINTTLNSLLNSVNAIDTQIDTITWENVAATFNVSNNLSNWSSSGYVSIGSNGYGYILLTDAYYRKTPIYKLTLQYGPTAQGKAVDLEIDFGYNNSGTFIKSEGSVMSYPDQAYRYTSSMNIYFTDVNDRNTSNQRTVIRLHNPSNQNLRLYVPTLLQRIQQTDIEYWTLLQYFNQYTYNKRILDAINAISINVSGDIINETETVINNYDTDFTTINNIESNFTNNFNTNNPGVIDLLDQNLDYPNGFISGSTFIKTLFPKVIDTNGLVGFPYFLILAVVVLLTILG